MRVLHFTKLHVTHSNGNRGEIHPQSLRRIPSPRPLNRRTCCRPALAAETCRRQALLVRSPTCLLTRVPIGATPHSFDFVRIGSGSTGYLRKRPTGAVLNHLNRSGDPLVFSAALWPIEC